VSGVGRAPCACEEREGHRAAPPTHPPCPRVSSPPSPRPAPCPLPLPLPSQSHHHHHRKKKKKAAQHTYPTLASVPEPYLPPHKLCLSAEERAAPPPTVLARAGEEVAAYCARLPPGSAEAAQCDEALDYFRSTTAAAGAACGVDPTVGGGGSGRGRGGAAAACDDLDRFEAFVKSLLYAGGVPSFVAALAQRRECEARDREQQQRDGSGAPSTSSSSSSSEVARRRAALVSLFHAYDKAGRGHLNADEFRGAMAAAAGGRALDGPAVSTILEALDVHGAGVSVDDFLAAVEADEVASHSPLATWLRRHPQDGSGAGWQHLPGSLDMLL
jgi:hypothetical protein